MQNSAPKNYQPSVELKFWTADASGQEEIEEWLTKEIDGEPGAVLYASFLNWCSAKVERLKNPTAKYKSAEGKAKAEGVHRVLRQQPLDVRAFIGLMEGYFRGSWIGGVKTGYIQRPNSSASKLISNPSHSHSFANLNGTEARDIMDGDKKLRSIVWSQRERDEMMLESGEFPMSKTGKMKLERTRREIEAEEEEEVGGRAVKGDERCYG